MKATLLTTLFICSTIALASGYETVLDPKILAKPSGHGPYNLPIQKQSLGFNKTNGRIFHIPLNIAGKQTIKLTIWHGIDNSGDKKMTWRLMDGTGTRQIASGDAGSEKPQTWTINKITTLRAILILEDADSKFSGKAAGNGFSFAVTFP